MKRLLAISVVAGAVALAGVAAAQKETRGVTKTEIVLGMHTDLSGPAATYGVSSSNAVKMRFDEVNEAGGIHGRKIRLIVEDTQYQVPRAVQAGAKLFNRDRVFAIVGGLGTPMNNALFKDQFDAGVLSLFPLSAARSMYDPFHKLKFYGAATYVDQVKAGINYFVTKKGKKALCAMYQDTDFGKEVLDGVQAQAEKMKLRIVETTAHKPTDQDFSPQITKLKAAGCDLVVLGTIVRDSIVPYATARKIGWTDVDFLGSAASYDLFVAAAQGGVTSSLNYWRTGQYYLNKGGPYAKFFPQVLKLSAGRFHVDYGFHLAPMDGTHIGEIEKLVKTHGVCSFKVFMFYGSHGLHGRSDSQREFLMVGPEDRYDFAHFEFVMRGVQAATRTRPWR